MKVHLSNQEFTEYLLGTGQSSTTEHIASCAECLQEAERVARALNAFKTWAHEESEKQVAVNVWAKAPVRVAQARRSVFAWSAAAAMTVAALALMLMLRHPHSGVPTQGTPGQIVVTNAKAPVTQVVQSQQQVSDDQLLLEVEQALDSSVPAALQPAAVLALDRNRVLQQTETRNQ